MRHLTSDEIETLRTVFGDGLDYSRVRINDNHWTANIAGVGGFVFGNNIQISEKYVGNREILVHETAHVWQFQGAWGWKYFFNAMFDHLRSRFGGHDPYDYSAFEGRIPWDKWNAEQQAKWVADNDKLPTPEILDPKSKSI
jgi:hypothetical protein